MMHRRSFLKAAALTPTAALLPRTEALPSSPQSILRATTPGEELRETLRSGARYLADTVLDANGRSRCDYDIIEGAWHLYEPAWHTGQCINGLLAAYEITGDDFMLDAARRAGNWWIGLEIQDHPRLTGYLRAVHGDYVKGDLINFTTIADGTPGLFRLFRHTGDRRYADVPIRAGNWAIENLYRSDVGLVIDLVEAETGAIITDRSPHIDREPTIHDVARPNIEGFLFKEMYDVTEDPRHRDVFLALCDSTVEKQDESGLWMRYHPNNAESGEAHPRMNTWYAEALVRAYDLTGEARYLDAATRTAEALTDWQSGDGRIYYENYLDGTVDEDSISGSAVAFAAMLWMDLRARGVDAFDDRVDRSADWLLKNQFALDHPDPSLRGAFLETRVRYQDGHVWMRNRDIATAFALRFLARYYRTQFDDAAMSSHGA